MSDTNKSRWKGRKESARALLTEQKKMHKSAHNRAVIAAVYMDGCPPRPDTHPAILLMETASEREQMRTAEYHQEMFELYAKALEDLEKIPNESEDQ